MLYEFDQQQISTITKSEPTDEQLMILIKARDEAGLSAIYHRHSALIRTVVFRIVHNDADVDDVIQQVFVELWNQAESYNADKGKVVGWLITLARRRAIDKVRRCQSYNRAEERLRLETEHEPQVARYEGVEDVVNSSDRAAILQRMLSALPEAQRQAIELAFYHGLSQREIAAKTGAPLGTVKTRLELGVRKLRGAVLSMGGVEEWSLIHG